MKLFLAIVLLSACTGTPTRDDIERALESNILRSHELVFDVRCGSHVKPDEHFVWQTCYATDPEGHDYKISWRGEARFMRFTIATPDGAGFLFSKATLAERTGEHVTCPYMEVRLDKTTYCRIDKSDDLLRMRLTDVEKEEWLWKRISTPKGLIERELARIELAALVKCDEVPHEQGSPGTCEIETSKGEKLHARFKFDESVDLERDGRPGIIFPTHITLASKRVELTCPSRFARANEVVRCMAGDEWIDIYSDGKGKVLRAEGEAQKQAIASRSR